MLKHYPEIMLTALIFTAASSLDAHGTVNKLMSKTKNAGLITTHMAGAALKGAGIFFSGVGTLYLLADVRKNPKMFNQNLGLTSFVGKCALVCATMIGSGHVLMKKTEHVLNDE